MRRLKVNMKQRGKAGVWYSLHWNTVKKVRVVKSLGTKDESEAERKRLALEAKINGEAHAQTVAEFFVDEYLDIRRSKRSGKGKRSEDQVIALFNRAIGSTVGDLPLADVDAKAVRKWLRLRQDAPTENGDSGHERAVSTRKLEYTYFKAIMRAAFDEGKISINPFANIGAPVADTDDERQDDVRDKVLTKQDIGRLLSHAAKYKHLWILMLHTGIRRGEALNILVDDIDFDARTLYIRSTKDRPTKSGKSRTVPLNDSAIRAIKVLGDYSWKKQWMRREYLLKQVYPGALSTSFRRDAARAGITTKATLHWTRHSFATTIVNGGTPLHKAAKILGHASVTTTESYLHAQDDDLHSEVDNLAY